MKVEKKTFEKQRKRIKRKLRIRKKIRGTADRPRLCVVRTNRHLYAQIIDDDKSHTIVAASTLEKDLSSLKNVVSDAEKFGEIIASRAKEKGINSVVFDRNGYLYHGIVRAIAEGARKGGLEF
ncbi:50S ribosomal protein L18 [Spirochaetia bacterium 38H-sp]|uniref:Large ribosomal subunit protein uL18 n=1 Tax=Rarispira pelagica TaxID=3141764 RepID=A0ABU9UE31_9SPIR